MIFLVFMERWGLVGGCEDSGRTQDKGLKWNCDCLLMQQKAPQSKEW